jgi:hypothetical protein
MLTDADVCILVGGAKIAVAVAKSAMPKSSAPSVGNSSVGNSSVGNSSVGKSVGKEGKPHTPLIRITQVT